MAFRYGQREQRTLLPPSIEEYVTASHPVRAYDAFVDTLEMAALGIDLDADKVGNAAYDPRAMLKLLVYGYSYGIRSSRKLERATHENLSFIWLLGGLKPDHKTIAEFRRKHVKGIKKVLRQSVWIAIELDLIAGNVLFVDGTKIQANAGQRLRMCIRLPTRLIRPTKYFRGPVRWLVRMPDTPIQRSWPKSMCKGLKWLSLRSARPCTKGRNPLARAIFLMIPRRTCIGALRDIR